MKEHEPAVALFGGDDGLRLYEELFKQISKMKPLPRYVLGEFGFLQRELIEKMLNNFFIHNAGLKLSEKPKIAFKKDGAGWDRIFLVDFYL